MMKYTPIIFYGLATILALVFIVSSYINTLNNRFISDSNHEILLDIQQDCKNK